MIGDPNTGVIFSQALLLTPVFSTYGQLTNMPTEYARRLKHARERKGLTQEELAEKAGVSQGMVGNGEAGTRGPGKGVLKLAKVLEVRPQWLAGEEDQMLEGDEQSASVLFRTVHPPALGARKAGLTFAGTVSANKVKVAGMAQLGADGFFEELGGGLPASGTVEAISDDPAAYALCIHGDSGFPAIRDGEYIVIEPSLTAVPTDRVVIVLSDGRTLLQELLVIKPDSITVASLDGSTRRTIQRCDIRSQFGIQPLTNIVSARKWSPDPPPT